MRKDDTATVTTTGADQTVTEFLLEPYNDMSVVVNVKTVGNPVVSSIVLEGCDDVPAVPASGVL